MKIYFIGQKGIPSHSGGVEKHVEDLASSLAQRGHEVFVYTRYNYTPKKLKEYRGVRLVGLPSVPTKHLDAITHTFFACLHVIFQRRADVVHFHSIGPSFWIWLVKLLKRRSTIVATFHSRCYEHQKWGGLAQRALRLGERMCVRYADKLIVVSRVLRDYVETSYQRKAYYIPNGVMPSSSLPPDEIYKKWGLEEKDYIVNVSRLIRHKGIHYLIRAFKELNTEKKLVIVGEGTYTDDYVRQIKEEAQDDPRVILTGVQFNDTLKELYSNAFAFVQPSEAEGLSISLLEAMSYGLPVISSNIEENQEALGDAGIFFQNKDHKDLAQKLEYLINNPETAQALGEKSKEKTRREYNWENIAEETLRAYSE